ncbi:MAG: hypothetical protein ACYCQJ_09685 [Nitrososphaerales archaeon]
MTSQVYEAFELSREAMKDAIHEADSNKRIDFVWKAYSRLELGIGLAKLAFRVDEQYSRRSLEKKKSDSETEVSLAKELLDSAEQDLQSGKVKSGLEKARKSRDCLKNLLLQAQRKGK